MPRRVRFTGIICRGKQCFRSWQDAANQAAWMRRMRHEKVSHYHCRACRFWHVGHDPR